MTASPSGVPDGLVAVTRRLPEAVDVLALGGADTLRFRRGGRGIVGFGRAATVAVPAGDPAAAADAVRVALGSVAVDDEVGRAASGVVAMGSVPFDPRHAGELCLPALAVVTDPDGTAWATAASPGGTVDPLEALATARQRPPSTPEPNRFELRSPRAPDEWAAMVGTVRNRIRVGDALAKVVLAREVHVRTDVALDPVTILRRLADAYSACILYATAGDRPLVGASPELLVARLGDTVLAHPLAGTAPRSGDPEVDARRAAELVRSTKDQEEHRVTIDMVHDTLLPYCSYLDEEAEPSLVAMANVTHLGTRVEGKLSAPAAHVIELVRALHPTPAVCGVPRAAALAVIDELEGLDRADYAGAVGWVDGAGNGEWAVAIRAAELDGTGARLFAGVGVLAGSDPAAELAETRAKLAALLGAIVRP